MSTTRRTDAPARRPLTELMDRQPPFDLQAEIGVLGSVILHQAALDDVMMILRPDDFYDDAHKKLFQHLCEMHEASKKFDTTLLVDRLKSNGDYELVGGTAAIAKIVNAVPNAAHAIYYAEIVREKSTLRALVFASTEILRDAYDSNQESMHLVGQAEQKIFSIIDKRSDSACKPIRDVLMAAMDRMDARAQGTHDDASVLTGFTKLDRQMGGLHNSELIVLAARPSMGKTAFALNIAEHVASVEDFPTLFVSLEMSSLELADRLICSSAKVNGHKVRAGFLTREDRIKLVDTASKLSQAPLFIEDAPTRTVTQIGAAARRIKRRQGKLGLIVIDYLQLIEPDNPKDQRQEQVAKMARRLKILARELAVPVLCLAQLNRQAEQGGGTVPRLSHLRESGAIEQDADVVMFVHRDEYYESKDPRDRDAAGMNGSNTGIARIIVAKQRNGPIGDVELAWFKEFTRFENLADEKRHSEFDSYNASRDFDQFNDRQPVDPSAGF